MSLPGVQLSDAIARAADGDRELEAELRQAFAARAASRNRLAQATHRVKVGSPGAQKRRAQQKAAKAARRRNRR